MMQGDLIKMLAVRAGQGRPLRVGLIGAGKFGTMFLCQARRIPGLQVLGIADLVPERGREALQRAGWPQEQMMEKDFARALKEGSTCITDDSDALIKADGMEVVIESTGSPSAGIRHALRSIEFGRHVVMVNVEADVLAGPLLAQHASAAGVVYTMGYGDQPALICELVDWARASGFEVVCAGKGAKYLPAYNASTPDTVWDHFGFTPEMVSTGDYNPKMYNAFLDGTKAAIEMAAVADATGLIPQSAGLNFPPCGADDLAHVLRPESVGGQLSHKGTVEVVSSLERDGRPVNRHMRWAVFVVIEADTEYVQRCFVEYGVVTDSTGRYAAMYRPYHLVGLELSVSVLQAGLRGEATGTTTDFNGDVVATAKRALAAGEMLDGEGGYCVFGKLMPAEHSLRVQALPIGLAHNLRLKHAVPAGGTVSWSDVDYDENDVTVRFRREMERQFARSIRNIP